MAVHGASGWVRVVDTTTRVELGGPFPVVEGNQPVALSPDGKELAVPAEAGVLVWDLDITDLVEAACRYAGRNLTAPEARAHLIEAHATCRTP
jgi:hypothetical protein